MYRTIIGRLAEWFLSRSRSMKRIISIFTDFVIVSTTLWLAFSLRYSEFYHPPHDQWWLFFTAPLIAIPIFIKFGLYRAIIRYIGVDALWTILRAVALFTLVFAAMVLLAGQDAGVVPRTVYGIHALLLLLVVGGSRLAARWLFNTSNQQQWHDLSTMRLIPPVLIYGAGMAGMQLASMLKLSRQLNPVAFIDDAASLQGQQINGLSVYSFDELTRLIEKFQVHDVLLAMPSIPRQRRSEIIRLLEPFPLHVRTLPDLMDIAEGRVKVSDIQEVDIGDLLGRDQIAPVQDLLHRNITEKVVMVTGAGGSIGSELSRQIALLKPKMLILYELNEFNLYQIEREIAALKHDIDVIAMLGSVTNRERVKAVCSKYHVETIYHAAAYKHVPMVEKNTSEGVFNNVIGTFHCAQAAIESHVETFVLISTDKAVRPTNTMGASKRLAELTLQALADIQNTTRFTMVRFGNVLGSSGSVVPLFREQIANGGPVTVTDSQIIRYFMTIPEAAELVIQAGAMGEGGDVFVLDMGDPVRILDLAKRMINLSGFSIHDEDNPDGDIEIIYTGLRPGEKLYEELLIGNNVSNTQHQKIMRAQERVISWKELEPVLLQLEQDCFNHDTQSIRKILLQKVDDFQPQCDVSDWLG